MIGLGLSITQLAVRQMLGFNPLSLFAANEPGVWYDPSDMSTLFQDAAGTTPVTAVEQPVGLMLDKSRGLVLGPELVVNTGGPFVNTDNWTPVPDAELSVVSGAMRVTNNVASVRRAYFSFNSVPGQSYVFVAAVSGAGGLVVGGRLAAGTGSQNETLGTTAPTASGLLRLQFVASGTTTFVQLVNQGTTLGGYADWAFASLKALPGNHATQATATARSIYRAAPQRLVYDGIDDSHNTTFAASLGTNCTIARAVPGVGTSILTGQTVGTTFTNTTTHAGLLVINRALTAGETAKLTDYFNAKAVV